MVLYTLYRTLFSNPQYPQLIADAHNRKIARVTKSNAAFLMDAINLTGIEKALRKAARKIGQDVHVESSLSYDPYHTYTLVAELGEPPAMPGCTRYVPEGSDNCP